MHAQNAGLEHCAAQQERGLCWMLDAGADVGGGTRAGGLRVVGMHGRAEVGAGSADGKREGV